MPWTYEEPPAVALNWTEEERRACVDAANAVIEETGDEGQAIFACIAAAGKDRAARDGAGGPRPYDRGGGKMADRKTYRGTIELKADADQTGEFTAEFATLDVIDHDGDVTTPGAFEDGQAVMIEAWNHNYGVPPVGKGVIHEGDGKASVEGAFFLDTQGGLEHYRVVKALGALQEWSYTFSIEDQSFGKFEEREVRFLRKLDVWGVAPVQRGAGIATRTVVVKGQEEIAPSQGSGQVSGAGTRPRNDRADGEGGPDGKGNPHPDPLPEREREGGDATPSGLRPSIVRARLETELIEL